MTPAHPLKVIPIENPCHKSWEKMTGDDRVRFCDQCGKNVHNLSAMPADESQRLLCESAGSLCVRFIPTEEGTIQTLEYQTPIPRRRFGLAMLLTILGVSSAGAATQYFRRPRPTAMIGMVCPRAPLPPVKAAPPPAGAVPSNAGTQKP